MQILGVGPDHISDGSPPERNRWFMSRFSWKVLMASGRIAPPQRHFFYILSVAADHSRLQSKDLMVTYGAPKSFLKVSLGSMLYSVLKNFFRCKPSSRFGTDDGGVVDVVTFLEVSSCSSSMNQELLCVGLLCIRFCSLH